MVYFKSSKKNYNSLPRWSEFNLQRGFSFYTFFKRYIIAILLALAGGISGGYDFKVLKEYISFLNFFIAITVIYL